VTVVVAAAAVTTLLSIASFLLVPVDSTAQVDGSSYSTHPLGARAAYLALRQAGYDMERSFEPLTAITWSTGDVLILAEPLVEPSQQDLRTLGRFVEEGGVLLATGARGAAFLPGAPNRRFARIRQTDSTATATLVSPLTRGVPQIRMRTASAAPGAPYVAVFGDDDRPAVMMARIGPGRAIWWSAATPLTNRGIAEEGHAELLANLLGPPGGRRIIWDEHYHGYRRSLWSYLRGTPVPFGLAQLSVVFVAAVLAFSRRRGPLRPPYEEPRTSPLEFVESIGALYERAGATAGVVGTVRAHVRRIVATSCGLPLATDDEGLSRGAANRLGTDAATIAGLLSASGAASRDPNLQPDRARGLVAGLQDLAAKLEALHGRSPRRGVVKGAMNR
jgi:hypothetical protein